MRTNAESEISTNPGTQTWRLWIGWSLLLAALSVLGTLVVGAILFRIGLTFNMPLGAFGRFVGFFVTLIVWTVGLRRCYQRHPSAVLMRAIAGTGGLFAIVFSISLPLFVIVLLGPWL